MGSLIVRNVDDELIGQLKARAKAHGRSVEAEHREILSAALRAKVGFDELAEQMRALTAGRPHTASEALMREGRDER